MNIDSVRSPSGARIEITIPNQSRSPSSVQVSKKSWSAITTIASKVRIVPPRNPSTDLAGLIHARSGVLPNAEPTKYAPMSLSTTPIARITSVSVPHGVPSGYCVVEMFEKSSSMPA